MSLKKLCALGEMIQPWTLYPIQENWRLTLWKPYRYCSWPTLRDFDDIPLYGLCDKWSPWTSRFISLMGLDFRDEWLMRHHSISSWMKKRNGNKEIQLILNHENPIQYIMTLTSNLTGIWSTVAKPVSEVVLQCYPKGVGAIVSGKLHEIRIACSAMTRVLVCKDIRSFIAQSSKC